ncbi:N-acetylglucosamine kinase [Exiguobacterium sp. s189]|uniref:N-acetylglucosamine kinase n=1 Tax=Exiguobacterium sp. s189 TaxID=2751263 RepID=UPI001BE6CD80|nr:BadF/BadG/BcrA/BcrD ATPase family protein [Exiguobacterium sp. s189]
MNYIVGVDGGGTKTEAVAYDLNGNKLSESKSGFGNLLIDETQAIHHIVRAIQDCIAPLKKQDCKYICIGLAGFGGVENTETIENALQETFSIPFSLFNDGIIAHAASLKGEDGVLTISGTGSVSIGMHNGHERMAGGWGHLLGDEGSGYWIAMQAFINMTKEEDLALPYSALSVDILSKLGYHNVSELKKFIYRATKAEIADFTQLIVKHAYSGDAFSRDILERAGIHLANKTILLCNALKLPPNVTIAIKGSVLINVKNVQESFIKQILEENPKANIITKDVSSTLGCYYLALKRIGT